MMLGFGWCHLRSSREGYRVANLSDIDSLDAAIDLTDEKLWSDFRRWIQANGEPYLQWQLFEQLNNDRGLLTFVVSRNHRASCVWDMLNWIAQNGPGSYGLFYCHDDEDVINRTAYNRNNPRDYDNVFRVHRIQHGTVTELTDPFFGAIEGGIDPIHPYHRTDLTNE
jgi:hypothetical protein